MARQWPLPRAECPARERDRVCRCASCSVRPRQMNSRQPHGRQGSGAQSLQDRGLFISLFNKNHMLQYIEVLHGQFLDKIWTKEFLNMCPVYPYKTKSGTRYQVKIRRLSRHMKLVDNKSFATRKEAERYEKNLLNVPHSAPSSSPTMNPTVDDLIEHYRQNYSGDKKPNTLYNQSFILEFWSRTLGPKSLSSLNQHDLVHWREYLLHEKHLKPGTTRGYLSLLRTLLRVAVIDLHWLDKSPMIRVKLPPDSPPRSNIPSTDDIKHLLKIAQDDENPIIHPVCYIAAYTGLRKNEILSLKFSQLNFKDSTIDLPVTKNELPHRVYVKDLQRLIHGYLSDMFYNKSKHPHLFPVTWTTVERYRTRQDKLIYNTPGHLYIFPSIKQNQPHNIKKAYARVAEKAEFPYVFHSFRHYFGTTLANFGRTDLDIQSAMNHKDIRSSRRYTKLTAERMKEIFGIVADTLTVEDDL